MARRNPFRSEAEAFRLVLLPIAGFAAIAVAALLGGWTPGPGRRRRRLSRSGCGGTSSRSRRRRTQQASTHVSAPDERRILVIANETVAGTEDRETIERGGGRLPRARARGDACAQLEAAALGVRRGRGSRRGRSSGSPTASPGSRRPASMRAARSAIPTRCSRSPTRCGRSVPTRDRRRAPGRPIQLAGGGVVDTRPRAVRRADHPRRRRSRGRSLVTAGMSRFPAVCRLREPQ